MLERDTRAHPWLPFLLFGTVLFRTVKTALNLGVLGFKLIDLYVIVGSVAGGFIIWFLGAWIIGRVRRKSGS